jgi:ERF superfamily
MTSNNDNTCTLFTDYNGLVSGVKALKSSTNPHFKNKFAPLDVWLDEAHRLCTLHNFILLEGMNTRELNGDLYVVHTATLLHTQGFKQTSEYFVTYADKPQAMGASVTYARRYNIQTLLTCTGEDDDDGNTAQAQVNTERASATTTVGMSRRKLA